MKKALVTGCDPNYLDGAEALLRSVARLHPEVDRYCLAPPATSPPRRGWGGS